LRRLKNIKEHTTIKKTIKYCLEQNGNTTLSDICDHIKMLTKLGMRIDKKSLFPENFAEAHFKLTEQCTRAEDEETEKAFKKENIKNTGMAEPFIDGDLMIRPAMSVHELHKESYSLSHCVRTYAKRVASGLTTILFIRKTADPDTPYYTLELDLEHKLVQCRGNHNCSYGPEIQNFIEKWLTWLAKKDRKAAA
jgi:hypothetical protein